PTDDNDLSVEDFLKGLMALGMVSIKAQFSGKVLRRVVKEGRAQLVQDYSGGSLVSQSSQVLSLYEDDTFVLEDKAFRAITGGGISLPSEKVRRVSGGWSLEMTGNQLYLVLKSGDGASLRWMVEEREQNV